MIAVIFLEDPPPPQKINPPSRFYLFNVLYYSPTWRFCAHYEDETYNPYTTESSSVKKKNQIKRKRSQPLSVFLGHCSLIKNKKQTAVINVLNLHIFGLRLHVSFVTLLTLDWFSKDNATANRTARAQENNRLGLGRELGRVARKGDLAKNNRTCGMWKHMFLKFVCSLVLWGISRLFFAVKIWLRT